MRLLLEIIIIGALIYIGWATPFRDYLPANISGVAKSKADAASQFNSRAASAPTTRPQPFARSTSTPSGAWMWDPNRHSALDRPTPKPANPR